MEREESFLEWREGEIERVEGTCGVWEGVVLELKGCRRKPNRERLLLLTSSLGAGLAAGEAVPTKIEEGCTLLLGSRSFREIVDIAMSYDGASPLGSATWSTEMTR
jgi:hypothetical protein